MIFHKFHGKQDSTVDELMENTFSTKSMENCIPQNLWKLKWKIILLKFHSKQDSTKEGKVNSTELFCGIWTSTSRWIHSKSKVTLKILVSTNCTLIVKIRSSPSCRNFLKRRLLYTTFENRKKVPGNQKSLGWKCL